MKRPSKSKQSSRTKSRLTKRYWKSVRKSLKQSLKQSLKHRRKKGEYVGTRYFVIEPGTIINQTIRNLAAIANAPNFMIGVPRRLPPGFPDPIPPYPFVYEEPDPVPVDTSVRDNAVAEWEAFKARGTATTAQIRELLIKVLPHLDENTFR